MTEDAAERESRWLQVGLLLFAVAGTAVFYVWDPRTSTFLLCPFHVMTGRHCPGCGSTRAFYFLVHGDILAALSMNALFVLAIPVVIGIIWVERWRWRAWMTKTALIIVIIFGIVRNLPFWPFELLAP